MDEGVTSATADWRLRMASDWISGRQTHSWRRRAPKGVRVWFPLSALGGGGGIGLRAWGGVVAAKHDGPGPSEATGDWLADGGGVG